MATVTYDDHTYTPTPDETVLDLLEREGHDVPSACRSGVCHTCLMKAVRGEPPAAARNGLKETLRAQGYFLACRCVPDEDLTVSLPDAGLQVGVRIEAIETLSERVLCLRVRPEAPFEYRAGQFVSLITPEGVARSYSIASVPGAVTTIDFQIALLPGGAMSGWLRNTAKPGDRLTMLGPNGNCFYVPGSPTQPLALIGTGTGLAPLQAIARDALEQGHTGPIHLFHGSVAREGLYLVDELRALAAAHPPFHYYPCVLEGPAVDGVHVGAVDAYALDTLGSLKGYRAFLCGAPDLVKALQRKVFLAGVSLQEIFADPFVPAATP